MSWHHFAGFIKLVQQHTVYFSYRLIVDDVESMLLRHRFLEKSNCDFGYVTKGKDVAICLECVKDDIERVGFSFWRRSHQNEINVCATHNVKLLKKCQFCDRAFRVENHCLNVLWSGCKCGRYILESETEINECSLELKRSKLNAAILNFDRKLDCVIAYESFLIALNCNERYKKLWNEVTDSRFDRVLCPWTKYDLHYEIKSYLSFGPEHLRVCCYIVTTLIFLLFTDFEEFIHSFKCILGKKSLQFESMTEKRASLDS
jgi:hypothetical protein